MIIISLFVLAYNTQYSESFAFSPSFSRQEAKDELLDWINMKKHSFACIRPTTTNSNNNNKLVNCINDVKDLFTDIADINYFSDGQTLNATLWLSFPLQHNRPNRDNNMLISYGMLIDSDNNERTGVGGIDYQVEVKWENGMWSRTFIEWSTLGQKRILDQKDNYTAFFGRAGSDNNVLTLFADLNEMGYPSKYKIVFYGEEKKKDSSIWNVDFTDWIHMPPPEFIISTSPSSIVLTPGEENTVDLLLNSTTGSEPQVHLSIVHPDPIKMDLSPADLHIPSFGKASSRLHIKVPQNYSESGAYIISIITNSTFPSEPFIKPISFGINNDGNNKNNNQSQIDPFFQVLSSFAKNSSVIQQASFIINVKPPIDFGEKLKILWNDWGSLIIYVTGIITGTVIPLTVTKIKHKKKM